MLQQQCIQSPPFPAGGCSAAYQACVNKFVIGLQKKGAPAGAQPSAAKRKAQPMVGTTCATVSPSSQQVSGCPAVIPQSSLGVVCAPNMSSCFAAAAAVAERGWFAAPAPLGPAHPPSAARKTGTDCQAARLIDISHVHAAHARRAHRPPQACINKFVTGMKGYSAASCNGAPLQVRGCGRRRAVSAPPASPASPAAVPLRRAANP